MRKMVGIIFIGDLYVCPYLNIYTQQLEEMNMDYEVLFWNRSNENLNLPARYKYCGVASEEEQFVVTKAIDFVKFRIWLKRELKKRKYEKLIVLSTLSGIILFDILKKYKCRYFFDIRDFSYESIMPFYKIETSIIKNSFATSISSPGFKHFLPKHEYIIAHNIQENELLLTNKAFQKKKKGDVLNLVWNGTMRYFEHQKLIIKNLANDSRFNLFFHGAGPELEQYKAFCEAIKARNVFFTGRYNNSDKASLLENADIINNSYWIDKEVEIRFAISNRFYDGLIYKIPQLVEAGTYKAKICDKYGVGIGLHPKANNFADNLYNWYFTINEETFNADCEKLMDVVRSDNERYEKAIRSFLKI